jgi:cytochrome c-type biogenesis protein CcmH
MRLARRPTCAILAPVVLSLSMLTGLAARAADAVDVYGEIQNPALQARYETITHDLRCLVCQNESIADSNVELASDLRRQVREMLIAGQSDDAIFRFMTDRYGEFVRFNPPLTPKTWLIWGAPFIMLAVGIVIVVRVARQRARLPLDDDPASEPH